MTTTTSRQQPSFSVAKRQEAALLAAFRAMTDSSKTKLLRRAKALYASDQMRTIYLLNRGPRC